MRFCYQVATPDVAVSPDVTAFQGRLEDSLDFLAGLGYDGVEFMTLDPDRLDRDGIRKELDRRKLMVSLVCTGEIFGQLHLSYMDRNPDVRSEAVARSKRIVDFASLLGANINIGRIHGQFRHDVEKETSLGWLTDALRELCDYAGERNVLVALENVTLMQTNVMNTCAEAAAVCDRVARPNCKIMMDVFHMNIEEKDMFRTIRDFAKYAVHVHLADNNRRYPGHCGLDFGKIIRAFRDADYDAAFTTEIYQLPSQEEAARGAIEHLAPIFKTVYGDAACFPKK